MLGPSLLAEIGSTVLDEPLGELDVALVGGDVKRRELMTTASWLPRVGPCAVQDQRFSLATGGIMQKVWVSERVLAYLYLSLG